MMIKKLSLLLIFTSLFFVGCQESEKVSDSVTMSDSAETSSPGKMSVFIEGQGSFPAELAGRWKSKDGDWGFVFKKDGSIAAARIATGRKIVTPGRVTYGETKRGGKKDIFQGIVIFDGLKEAGDYEARLYFNDAFDLKAVYSFSVGKETALPNPPVKPGLPFVKTYKGSYAIDETIEVEFNNASGAPLDWLGICKKGSEGNASSVIDWFYTDGRKLGESRYVPGDWIVTYSPQSRELSVELEMRDIYIEMAGDVIHGHTLSHFIGTVSEDGTKWKGSLFSYPYFDNFPIDPSNLPEEYTMEFTKTTGDI